MIAVTSPLPQFFDLDGSPLDNGRLFFGLVDQNPETAPTTVYWDEAGTQPAAQPLQTRNGHIARSGNVATVYVDGSFSLTVRNKSGAMVYYTPNGNTLFDGLLNAINASLAPAVQSTETVDSLRLVEGASPFLQTQGYWSARDGGAALYALQPESSPSPGDNGGLYIERADGRWYAMVTTGSHVNVSALGVYCPPERLEEPAAAPGKFNRWTGAKPSVYLAPSFLPIGYSTTDNLTEAFAQLRSIGKGALISGVVHCDKQLSIDAPLNVMFAGKTGRAAGNLDLTLPSSYFFQADVAMVGSVLILVEHPGIHFVGGGIVGPVYFDAAADFYFPEGPARDGIFVGANGFRWDNGCVARMGRDGVRIGDYSGGSGTNANSVRLDGCAFAYNGSNGLTINDASGSLDANAFQIDNLFSHHNQNSGIELANTYLGGLFNAPVVENNARGWFINNTASGIVIVAGDTEANTGWRGDLPMPYTVASPLNNIEEDPAVAGLNFFVNHVVQGIVRHDLPTSTRMKHDQATRTGLFLENLSASTSADCVYGLTTTAGDAALWKRSDAVGGELFVGNEGAYPLGFITSNIIRMAITSGGALALGGLSAVGTPGQVLTSAGPGTPPIWSSFGGGGGGSPLTTKGDLFTYSTAADRLPVGTNGQVLTADSTQPTGLRWLTVTGTGTVTSVGMTVPLGLSVSGSPITGAGSFGVAWAAGYQGFLTADKVKLDSITVASLALKNAANTFSEPQTFSKNQNAPTGAYIINTDAGSGANAECLLSASGGTGGMRLLSSAAGGQLIFGNLHTGEVAIMQNGVFRIVIDASGNIELRGLPGGSGGNPERVWRDGSGYVRIG